MTRVLVCGGRNYDDWEPLFAVLDALLGQNDLVIIQGGAPGADGIARMWSRSRKCECLNFPADWRKQGRAAGPIRNHRMLAEGKPDLVLAAPGGRGTADMVRQARAAGLEVREIASEGGGE
jgi:hypothetical protein